MSNITKEDFSAWKDNKVTEAFLDYLKRSVELANDYWVHAMADPRMDAKQIEKLRIELNAKIELCMDIIELELEDMKEETDASNVVAING